MRIFLGLVLATLILGGAYTLTYGLPPALAAMVGANPKVDTAAPTAAKTAANPGQRGGGGGRSNVTTVVTTPLTLQPYESTLNAVGTASALRSVDVVANAAGTVAQVNLAASRTVTAGEVLVRLDARSQTLNLEIAQANLDKATETVSRYAALRANGNSTVTDVTLSEAQIGQRLAAAAVGLAQIALDDRTIHAPISGQLSPQNIDIGDVLAANSVIASIDQSDALIIEFELAERAIALLARARTVLASTPTFTGLVFEADVISYDSRVDSVTRSVTVKARIENPDGLLWPGMTFAVRLIQQSDPLPALPATAITWSRAGSAVWIDDGGIAQPVPVTILFRQDDTVWIDADIAVGTPVVTEGAQKLQTGARITTPGATLRERPDGAPKPKGERTAQTPKPAAGTQ